MRAVKNFISGLGIFGELLMFLWQRKLWWLIPMIIILVLFGLLLVLTQSPVGPFIYTLY